jgi:hypothetical protein
MYRAVVLTTLVILLLSVAGVSVAQDGQIFSSGGSNGDDTPGSTAPEATSTGASMAEDPQTGASPGASSGPEDGEDAYEPTVEETEDTEKPDVNTPAAEQTRAPASNDVPKPVGGGKGIGRPEHAGKAPNIGNSRPDVGHPAKGNPGDMGNEEEHGRGVGQQKVALCHKNRTITVGAPALGAHLRHGDTQDACQLEGPTPSTSGETMEPEAAKSGVSSGSGGQRVTICHKGKLTLAVGAAARAAHLRHGDSLGACL